MGDDKSASGAPKSLDAAIEAANPATPNSTATDTPVTADDQEVVKYRGKYSFADTQRDLAFRLVSVMIGIVVVIAIVSVTYSISCWARPGTEPQPCGAAGAALNLLTTSLSPVFTAMVGLVGSVVGFYFGSKQSSPG